MWEEENTPPSCDEGAGGVWVVRASHSVEPRTTTALGWVHHAAWILIC